MRVLKVTSKVDELPHHQLVQEHIQVIMRPEYVGRDGRGEVTSELLLVGTSTIISKNRASNCRLEGALVLDVHHAFRMRVAKVALMGRSRVNLVFIEWIFDLVGEHTS